MPCSLIEYHKQAWEGSARQKMKWVLQLERGLCCGVGVREGNGGVVVVPEDALGYDRGFNTWATALAQMHNFLCERNDKNKKQKYYHSDRK